MKDYNHNGHTSPPDSPQSDATRIHDTIPAMHENDAPTLLLALRAVSRERAKAEAKIAILEYTVKVYETHPLLAAYDALQATEQQLIVVGEMVCPAAPTGRLREVGTLLDVLTRLGAQYRLFSTQVIRLDEKVEEMKNAS